MILLVGSTVLGVVTVFFLRSFLVDRLDQQLEKPGRWLLGQPRTREGAPDGDDGDADNAVPGQSTGTMGRRTVDGKVTQAAIVTPQGKDRLLHFDSSDIKELRQLMAGGKPRSAELDAVGSYRPGD